MTFFYKSSPTVGFIVCSSYGLQSHIVMNEHGVTFCCNPKGTTSDRQEAMVYSDEASATLAKDEFFNQVVECKFIAKAVKTF